MIRSAAEFLANLVEAEKQKLDEFDVHHGPTIGSMYEGLTADVVGRVIPQELGLTVTKGFVLDGVGGTSGQIDCMLVQGEGEPIPYSDAHRWHVRDVIAVIEIKKTLLGGNLADAFTHLAQIRELERAYLQSERESRETVDLRSALRAYEEITRKVAPTMEEAKELPPDEHIFFHTLLSEHWGPLKIVIGYDGFRTEFGFREAMVKLLTANIGKRGYGPGSAPELIVSGGFSLVKANGSPYSVPMHDGYWDFYFSSPTNPLIFLLEVLWTQLDRRFGVKGLWGEDLELEVAHPFLAGWPAERGEVLGWDIVYRPISAQDLQANSDPEQWTPAYLTVEEAEVIARLCAGEVVHLDDPEVRAWLVDRGVTVDQLRTGLLKSDLVAMKGDEVRLTTENCQMAVLPTEETVAAENNTGRLDRWIQRQLGEQH